MSGAAKQTIQRRTVLRLWYENMGGRCGYCGIEMLPLEEALKFNDRHRPSVRDLYSKEEKRKADNHPTIDHVVPRAKGGRNLMKNYVVACHKCNNEKQDTDHPGLMRDMKLLWFETIDRHMIGFKSKPYPDPY